MILYKRNLWLKIDLKLTLINWRFPQRCLWLLAVGVSSLTTAFCIAENCINISVFLLFWSEFGTIQTNWRPNVCQKYGGIKIEAGWTALMKDAMIFWGQSIASWEWKKRKRSCAGSSKVFFVKGRYNWTNWTILGLPNSEFQAEFDQIILLLTCNDFFIRKRQGNAGYM